MILPLQQSTLWPSMPSTMRDKPIPSQTASQLVRMTTHALKTLENHYQAAAIAPVLCLCVERVPAPVSVRSSEVTTNSFRVSWQHSASDISLYRLSWMPANGGETREVLKQAQTYQHNRNHAIVHTHKAGGFLSLFNRKIAFLSAFTHHKFKQHTLCKNIYF